MTLKLIDDRLLRLESVEKSYENIWDIIVELEDRLPCSVRLARYAFKLDSKV